MKSCSSSGVAAATDAKSSWRCSRRSRAEQRSCSVSVARNSSRVPRDSRSSHDQPQLSNTTGTGSGPQLSSAANTLALVDEKSPEI